MLVNSLLNPGPEVLIGLLCLASLRVYLEVIKFDFTKLPMTKALANRAGRDHIQKFHKMGLVFSVGFILLFAPELLLS
ncbi:hypothetical protein OAT67_06865 [Bacteriovoracaceae bacterium]|nr:hypothetical protein [Bacteriovoracaceae bacterium]